MRGSDVMRADVENSTDLEDLRHSVAGPFCMLVFYHHHCCKWVIDAGDCAEAPLAKEGTTAQHQW